MKRTFTGITNAAVVCVYFRSEFIYMLIGAFFGQVLQ